jgi:hypothetical protein
MARRHHRYHRRHRRHNPLGLSKGVVTDAAYTAAGALGSLWLGGLVPNFSTGWAGVATTGAAGLAISFAGGLLGVNPKAREELLTGGLTATIIRALHELGVAKNIGLGMYAPSYFSVPTSSSQYLQSAQPSYAFRRGAGSIFFPGPGAVPALPAPAGVSGMGFHRFRSRYAGNY